MVVMDPWDDGKGSGGVGMDTIENLYDDSYVRSGAVIIISLLVVM